MNGIPLFCSIFWLPGFYDITLKPLENKLLSGVSQQTSEGMSAVSAPELSEPPRPSPTGHSGQLTDVDVLETDGTCYPKGPNEVCRVSILWIITMVGGTYSLKLGARSL